MRVLREADQKIPYGQNHAAFFDAGGGDEIVLGYIGLYFHIIQKIQVDAFFAVQHQVQIQISPVGFPETVFRFRGFICNNVYKKIVPMDGIGTGFQLGQRMRVGVINAFLQLAAKLCAMFLIVDVSKNHGCHLPNIQQFVVSDISIGDFVIGYKLFFKMESPFVIALIFIKSVNIASIFLYILTPLSKASFSWVMKNAPSEQRSGSLVILIKA